MITTDGPAWRDQTPDLTITRLGVVTRRRCMTVTHYEIRSRRALTQDEIKSLRCLKMLGHGQDYVVGNVQIVTYPVKCTMPNGDQAYNRYTNDAHADMNVKLYVYAVIDTCDSGD